MHTAAKLAPTPWLMAQKGREIVCAHRPVAVATRGSLQAHPQHCVHTPKIMLVCKLCVMQSMQRRELMHHSTDTHKRLEPIARAAAHTLHVCRCDAWHTPTTSAQDTHPHGVISGCQHMQADTFHAHRYTMLLVAIAPCHMCAPCANTQARQMCSPHCPLPAMFLFPCDPHQTLCPASAPALASDCVACPVTPLSHGFTCTQAAPARFDVLCLLVLCCP